jgi:hypothetical protein
MLTGKNVDPGAKLDIASFYGLTGDISEPSLSLPALASAPPKEKNNHIIANRESESLPVIGPALFKRTRRESLYNMLSRKGKQKKEKYAEETAAYDFSPEAVAERKVEQQQVQNKRIARKEAKKKRLAAGREQWQLDHADSLLQQRKNHLKEKIERAEGDPHKLSRLLEIYTSEQDQNIVKTVVGYDIYKMLPVWKEIGIGQDKHWNHDHSQHHGEVVHHDLTME